MFSKEFNARAQICMQMLTGSIGRNSFGEIVIRLQPYKNYRENTEKLWKWPGNTCRKRVLAQMRKLCDTISSIWGNKIIKIDWIDHAATKTTKSSVCHILISHLWLIFFGENQTKSAISMQIPYHSYFHTQAFLVLCNGCIAISVDVKCMIFIVRFWKTFCINFMTMNLFYEPVMPRPLILPHPIHIDDFFCSCSLRLKHLVCILVIQIRCQNILVGSGDQFLFI